MFICVDQCIFQIFLSIYHILYVESNVDSSNFIV